ncbi:MAG: hypothetical protein ACP5I8_03560 [Phycisphaerae bacterium]
MMSSNSKTLPRQAHTVVNHRRIFTVLASLVGTLAATAGILLLLEGQPVTSAGPYLLNLSNVRQNWQSLIRPAVGLQNGRWNYIIVYQSGKLSGNAAAISEGKDIGGLIKPLNAGNMTQGAEFHFVVDNTNNGIGNPDGYVQQGLAWREQLSTAPYFSWPYLIPHHQIAYANAVGVCLVGDINRTNYSSSQVHSLLALVRTLQRRLNIPDSCVKFQWEIQGRPTVRERAFSREFHHLLQH